MKPAHISPQLWAEWMDFWRLMLYVGLALLGFKIGLWWLDRRKPK